MKNLLVKLALLVFIVFSGLNSAEALIQGWVPQDDCGEAASDEMEMESVEEELGMESQSEELILEDIYRDEQVFPFPSGLCN